MKMNSLVIWSTVKTLKANVSRIPCSFKWCEIVEELLGVIRGENSGEIFHLVVFDEPTTFNFHELLSMDTIVDVEICYKVPYLQRIKHDKIRYTSIEMCLFRWHYIEYQSSQSNAQRFGESRDRKQLLHEATVRFYRKELMMITDSN